METKDWLDIIDTVVPVIGGGVTFLWGVWLWKQNADRREDNRRMEASRPFLDMQLKLYTEAAQIAARIANASGDPDKDKLRFWELYAGELSMVEDFDVANCMSEFGTALKKECDQENMQKASIALAHAMRDSLARSWSTNAWRMTFPESAAP